MNAKAKTLLAAFDHLPEGAVIVEIGCARFEDERATDGWSTVHLGAKAALRGWVVHSVDVDEHAVDIASSLTDPSVVTVHRADGARWLRSCGLTIDGLYLDGAADPEEALEQYEAAVLAKGAVVAIDDLQPIGKHGLGKGTVLLERLWADGFAIRVVETVTGYRMAVAR